MLALAGAASWKQYLHWAAKNPVRLVSMLWSKLSSSPAVIFTWRLTQTFTWFLLLSKDISI